MKNGKMYCDWQSLLETDTIQDDNWTKKYIYKTVGCITLKWTMEPEKADDPFYCSFFLQVSKSGQFSFVGHTLKESVVLENSFGYKEETFFS